MLSINDVDEFIHKICEQVKVSKNNTHWNARCPICGDSKRKKTKKRFHIDWKNGFPVFNCFNCNNSGSFYKLYSLFSDIDEKEAFKKFNSYNCDQIKDKLSQKSIPISNDERYKIEDHSYILNDCVDDIQFVNGFQKSIAQKNLKKFKKDRKLDNIKLYIAYKGKYIGRIIIPVYYKNMMVYFQARRIRNDTNTPKYLNPVVKKDKIILHEDVFDKDKFIIVTEGLIDAYNIGNQGTSCLGKEISDNFIEKLFNYSKKIILAYDNDDDGIKSRKNFMNKSKYANKVKYFLMPKNFKNIKDINELYSKYNIENLYKFILENSYSKEKTIVMEIK